MTAAFRGGQTGTRPLVSWRPPAARFVALTSRDPSWPNHRSERILVHAAECRVKRVARIPIVRPDWMDSVRASRDVDVVAKERALTQRNEQRKEYEVRIEGDVRHPDIRRETRTTVFGLGVEHVETRDRAVGELPQPAIIPGDADDAARGGDGGIEVLAQGNVIHSDRARPGYAAVRGTGEENVRIPLAVIGRD